MRKRTLCYSILSLLAVIVLFSTFTVQVAYAQEIYGSNWTGEYFNNRDFSGSPAFTRIDNAINFNFGQGSPIPGTINPDNFSIRWTGVQTFAQGTYEFIATVDDGVRVYIDNVIIIDAFRGGPTFTVTATVDVAAGPRTIRVEYYDASLDANISFRWRLAGSGAPIATGVVVGPTAIPGTPLPTSTPAPTALPDIPPGALTATVIRAQVLNVRDAASLGGNVIGRIRRGQTYAVVGRNHNATWFLLQLSGYQGWAWGYYLFINGNEFNAPVVSSSVTLGAQPQPAPPSAGVVGQTQAGMRLRAEPNINSPQIGRIPWGALIPIVGRSADGLWYQVTWANTNGWVFASYVRIREGDINNVPVR